MATRVSNAHIMEKLEELTEKVERIERKVLAYDRLKERAIGALAAGSVFIAALWWLTKERFSSFFGVHG